MSEQKSRYELQKSQIWFGYFPRLWRAIEYFVQHINEQIWKLQVAFGSKDLLLNICDLFISL